MQYIENIAEILRGGGEVYLAPAALETVIIAKLLKEKYRVLPSGFCDNDIKKQGKALNSLPELRIFSFDDAIKKRNASFLIYSPHHSAEIIGNLIYERGVAVEKIINYHLIERRKTCALMAHNWIVVDRAFVCCCIEEYKPIFDNKSLNPREGLEYLDSTRKAIINGSLPMPEGCVDCFNNKESYIYASRKLNSFDFSFRGWCNYKCQYCSSNQPDIKGYNDRFSLEEYLVELEKMDMINDIFSVLYAVGESCLNEKRFGLYEYCERKHYFLDVFSNCSVFDRRLFEVAHQSPVIIRKSFDAGTPETYKRIKGVDLFDKAVENVRHYLEAPYIAINLKYLFMPGINDNEKDIENFAEMCGDMKIDFVTPSFSFLDNSYRDSKHAQEMFGLLVRELTKKGVLTVNVDTLYSEGYRKLYAESFA